jgi:hypothetical protein
MIMACATSPCNVGRSEATMAALILSDMVLNTLLNIPRRLKNWFERSERRRNGGSLIEKSTSV